MERLEAGVGLSCTFCPFPLLKGELKSRYSDFLVNEISEDGTIVRLTKFWPHVVEGVIPETSTPETQSQDAYALMESIIGKESAVFVMGLLDPESSNGGEKEMSITVPMPEDKAVRKTLHESVRSLSKCSLDSDSLTLADGSKCIRISRPPKGVVAGKRARDEGRGPTPNGGWHRNSWAPSRPPYLHFVLNKVNLDSGAAIRGLAAALGCKERSVGYAGLKDKRASTSQCLSLYHMEPERVVRACRAVKGLYVGDFSYSSQSLHLGQLWGNRFTITVRGLSIHPPPPPLLTEVSAAAITTTPSPQQVVSDAMSAWESCGYRFISYFGLQRFGGTASLGHEGGLCTHLIGKALLRQDWVGALKLILSPRVWDTSECGTAATSALLDFAGGKTSPREALQALPKVSNCSLERKILGELSRYLEGPGGLDALERGQALEVILTMPPSQRSFYVHAYQSVLWNILASARCSSRPHFSKYAVEGDLVLLKPAPSSGAATGEGGGIGSDIPSRCLEEAWEHGIEEDMGEANVGVVGGRLDTDESFPHSAHVGGQSTPVATVGTSINAFGLPDPKLIHQVSAEEEAGGVYSIDDVLLTIPGASPIYSSSPQWGLSALASLLEKDGFQVSDSMGGASEVIPTGSVEDSSSASSSGSSNVEALIRKLFTPRDQRFHFSGGYRRLVGRVEDVSWKLIEYTRPDESLAETDFDVIMKARQGGKTNSRVGESGGMEGACANPPGPLLALQLAFSLKKSHYATVALREVLAA